MTDESECVFQSLKGKTIVKIERNDLKDGDSPLYHKFFFRFYTINNDNHKEGVELYHYHSCCEDVDIHEVTGDFDDLLNSPILISDITSNITYEGTCAWDKDYQKEWTFYKLSTIKGSVTISFYGESNGSYTTEVTARNFLEKKNDT